MGSNHVQADQQIQIAKADSPVKARDHQHNCREKLSEYEQKAKVAEGKGVMAGIAGRRLANERAELVHLGSVPDQAIEEAGVRLRDELVERYPRKSISHSSRDDSDPVETYGS